MNRQVKKGIVVFAVLGMVFSSTAIAVEWVNPLKPEYRATETGGSKSLSTVYKDGVGVLVVAPVSKVDDNTNVDYSYINKLALKYASAAEASGMTVDQYVLTHTNLADPKDIEFATLLKNSISSTLESSPTCPVGFSYNAGVCIKGGVSYLPAECPTGYSLSAAGNSCEKTVISYSSPTCPTGYSYNPVDNSCSQSPISYEATTCPSGYSKVNNACEKTVTSTRSATANTVVGDCPYGFMHGSSYDYNNNTSKACYRNQAGFSGTMTFYSKRITSTTYSCNSGETLQGNQCISTSVVTTSPICAAGTIEGTQCKIVTTNYSAPICSIGIIEGNSCKIDTISSAALICQSGILYNGTQCKIDTTEIVDPTCPPRTSLDINLNKCVYAY